MCGGVYGVYSHLKIHSQNLLGVGVYGVYGVYEVYEVYGVYGVIMADGMRASDGRKQRNLYTHTQTHQLLVLQRYPSETHPHCMHLQ